ncbi:MAG: helix-turn-helix domain-containing protein [Nitrospirota bacterium]|nr:helix-turn-helix domain-containing protein [Nitrospirota bacterium]
MNPQHPSATPPPPPPSPELDARADMAARLRSANIPPQHDYTTGEVARILGISRETVRQMVMRWEPPSVSGRHPTGLFAMKLGRKHRIPYRALVDWLTANTAYRREME